MLRLQAQGSNVQTSQRTNGSEKSKEAWKSGEWSAYYSNDIRSLNLVCQRWGNYMIVKRDIFRFNMLPIQVSNGHRVSSSYRFWHNSFLCLNAFHSTRRHAWMVWPRPGFSKMFSNFMGVSLPFPLLGSISIPTEESTDSQRYWGVLTETWKLYHSSILPCQKIVQGQAPSACNWNLLPAGLSLTYVTDYRWT